ncbi:unnamed protein product [Cunninghamella blakesleeana]
MGKGLIITEDIPIATVEGWEDGEHYERHLTKLDCWELQNADKLTIHIGEHDIILVQDPHSNYLGGYVWLSSIVFCSYLDALHAIANKRRGDRHEWIHLNHDKKWVELGAGVGLLGLMLHKLGVEHVIMTDIQELVPTMEKNVEANDMLVHSITGRRENKTTDATKGITIEPLLWNDDDAIRHIKSDGKIDYILACDCIYSEASAIDLVATMAKLADPDTIIVCLSELRNQAAQDTFMEEAKKVFIVELIPPVQWQKKVGNVDFDETLNLYRIYKPSNSKINSQHGKKKKRTLKAILLKHNVNIMIQKQ